MGLCEERARKGENKCEVLVKNACTMERRHEWLVLGDAAGPGGRGRGKHWKMKEVKMRFQIREGGRNNTSSGQEDNGSANGRRGRGNRNRT